MTQINPLELKEIKNEFKRRGIPFSDRHTHSISKYTKSFDLSKAPPVDGPCLDVVEVADQCGLDEVSITDHSYEILPLPQMEDPTQLQLKFGEKTFGEYLNYLENVRLKFSNIRVLKGIELKVRKLGDLDYFAKERFSDLDFILIETPERKLDFDGIRKVLGKSPTIILAHPEPAYIFGEEWDNRDIDEWVDSMKLNNFHFDLNRQFLDRFITGAPIYEKFFEVARKRGILFSIGTDWHGKAGDYAKFFSKVLRVIDKYGLEGKDFLNIK